MALVLAGCGERQIFGDGQGGALPVDAAGCVTEKVAAQERTKRMLDNRQGPSLWASAALASIDNAFGQCIKRVSATTAQVIRAEQVITEDSPGVVARVPNRRRCDSVFVGGSGYCFQ